MGKSDAIMASSLENQAVQRSPGTHKAETIVVNNPIKRHPRRFIAERRNPDALWAALRCNPIRGNEQSGFFPTQWLKVNGDYFARVRNLRKPNFWITILDQMNDRNGAFLRLELPTTGELFCVRFGQRAQIRSSTAETEDRHCLGGQKGFLDVPRSAGPQGKKKAGVLHHLMAGLIYPEEGAIPYRRTSHIDNAKCLVYVEANVQVSIQRYGYRVVIIPGFE